MNSDSLIGALRCRLCSTTDTLALDTFEQKPVEIHRIPAKNAAVAG
jgi:hypothetical protein